MLLAAINLLIAPGCIPKYSRETFYFFPPIKNELDAQHRYHALPMQSPLFGFDLFQFCRKIAAVMLSAAILSLPLLVSCPRPVDTTLYKNNKNFLHKSPYHSYI